MKRTFGLLCALAALGPAATVHAQDSTRSVSEVLTFLVTNQSVSTGSPERDQAAAQATSATMSRALLARLATLPVTSSTSAFSYRLNPDLGTVERSTNSFGPFFIERALTAGGSTASLGVTYQHTRFTSLDGRSLRDGSLVTTANQFVDEAEPYEVDRLTLNIDADIATVYGNIGLGNRTEVGFALPFVALRLNGLRVDTYRGRTFTQASASATSLGVADAVLRTKVTLYDEDGQSFGAAVEARLPTGREEDLLGAGSMSFRFAGIGSIEGPHVSGHVNAGVSVGGLAREFSYGGAVAANPSPRLTITGELLGRYIDSPGHIDSVIAPHPTLSGVETIRLAAHPGQLHAVAVAPGLKWNLADTWVLVSNVSIPLTRGGLTASFTPFVGFDYSMER
jgi:hypothetical protein